MKVVKIKKIVGKKLVEGSLPDIDIDFAGKDREYIKAYMERRFGKTQVCAVGTHTTMQIKGLIKDFDRQFDNNFATTNIITSIIDNKDTSMEDLFKRAAQEPKLKNFIKEQSDIFYMMPKLLDQPKVESIHACAMIVFPNVMKATEWAPMRIQNGMLVSEWSGEKMDEAGFLKDDILGIKQLDKFSDIIELIRKNGKEVPDIYNLPYNAEVYRYLGNGWNGDAFQLGSDGMTEYTKVLKPQTMEDLIATVSLYRPGPMENGYHNIYAKCKNEGRIPEYLWGTENITKDTYGLIIYQEQVMQVCQELGGLTMKEADDVRRAMGKKKLDVLEAWRDRVEQGFLEKGCPQDEFDKIWDTMLEFAKYSFNRSHAAAYAKTGYVSMYLKVNFPLEYWTVSLGYADENKTLKFLSEISQSKSLKILPPDINESDMDMSSNAEENVIYWGINSIKGIGENTATQIIKERIDNGKYQGLEDFIKRHTFKGSAVKKQTYEALISSGAFDEIEDKSRKDLIEQFRLLKKVKIANKDKDVYSNGKLDESWWWVLKQKELTGLAFFDYENISKEMDFETPFASQIETSRNQNKGIFRTFGGYVIEMKIGRSKKGQYARLLIENNYTLHKVVVWNEQYSVLKDQLKNCEKALILFTAELKYEAKWTKGNQWMFTDDTSIKVLK